MATDSIRAATNGADLPAVDQYYRPARARELRARVARLERWCWYRRSLPGWVAALWHGAFWTVWFGWLVCSVDAYPRWFRLSLVALLVILILLATPVWLCQQTEHLSGEAAALEAEHESRYGANGGAE